MNAPDPTEQPIPPEPVRVVLVDAPERYGDAPFPVRLRRALKCLLRGFGLRCTSITPDRPELPPVVTPEEPAMNTTGFVLWYRPTRRGRWSPVAEAPTETEASGKMDATGKHHGQWLTLPAGQDANAKPPAR